MLRSSSMTRGSPARAIAASTRVAARRNAAAPASSRSRMPRASATASRKRASSSGWVSSSSQAGLRAATTPLTLSGRTPSTSERVIVWPLSLASTPCTRRSSTAAAASWLPASAAPCSRQTSPKLA
jgi:hypothetical protein